MRKVSSFVAVTAVLAGVVVAPVSARAQATVFVTSTCGTAGPYIAGTRQYPTMDLNGNTCTSGSGGGGGGAVTLAAGSVSAGAYVSGSIGAGAISDLGTGATPAAYTTNAYLAQLHLDVIAPLAAGTNSIGTVGLNAGTNTIGGTYLVPQTSGGVSGYHLLPLASDNHAVIKNGAGMLYTVDATNIGSGYQNLRLYDAGTGFNGCNSATNLLWGTLVPGASGTGAGIVKETLYGRAFSNGLAICYTGAYGDTDTTNAVVSTSVLNIGYK